MIDAIARGMSVYDAAKWMGDTVATAETHYAEWITELRDRARRLIESEEG